MLLRACGSAHAQQIRIIGMAQQCGGDHL